MSGSTYPVASYDEMFADRVRTLAYLEAIRREVQPDDVVLEVGTGTGYFAVAAARAGARQVYAVERAAMTGLAALLAEENGVADRITFIRGDGAAVELPQRATVLLCDLRGATPFYGDGIATILAVRDRLLVPGARMIPRRDVVWAAPCTAPRGWRETELALGAAPHGIRRTAVSRVVRSDLDRHSVQPSELLAPPVALATIDYRAIMSPDVDADADWTFDRDDAVHGFAMWFDATLADGVGFTTAPGAPGTVYGQAFLPLERAVAIRAGDRMQLAFRAMMAGGAFALAWGTTITDAASGRREEMQQSTLGTLLGRETDLARRRSTFVPDADTGAEIATTLALVDGRRSLDELAAAVQAALPGTFASRSAAFDWMSRLVVAIDDLRP